jgi:hypothetical protein
MSWNPSFRATKSVSELISTIAASLPFTSTCTKPSAGMMDCKKALTETDGDIDKAIDYLREKGIAKAAKKADRIAAEGLVRFEQRNQFQS